MRTGAICSVPTSRHPFPISRGVVGPSEMAKGRFGMCDPPQPGDVYLLRQCGGVLDHANGPPADARIVAGRLQPPSSAQQLSGRTPGRVSGRRRVYPGPQPAAIRTGLVDQSRGGLPRLQSSCSISSRSLHPSWKRSARCDTRQKLREHVVHVAADLGDVRGVDERAPDRVPDEAVVRIEGDAG